MELLCNYISTTPTYAGMFIVESGGNSNISCNFSNNTTSLSKIDYELNGTTYLEVTSSGLNFENNALTSVGSISST